VRLEGFRHLFIFGGARKFSVEGTQNKLLGSIFPYTPLMRFISIDDYLLFRIAASVYNSGRDLIFFQLYLIYYFGVTDK